MVRFLMGLTGLWIGLAGLLSTQCTAQTQYVPSNDSRVWIEGTSNVTDFTCSTQQIDGHARLALRGTFLPAAASSDSMPTHSTAPSRSSESPTVQARVPVRTLDCGKRRQNRDLYDAMKAGEHPAIHYTIVKADVMATPDSSRDHYVLEAIGELTIAGATRTVRLTLQGRRLDDGRMHAQGTLPIQMTNFDVEPPTAMLGLIRVHDEITVHFDITAVPQTE